MEEKIIQVQSALQRAGWDGWLFYDFRRSNDIACEFLQIAPEALLTRRFFYWIPARGESVRVRHAIEGQALAHLPGKELLYRSWQQYEWAIATLLSGAQIVAMEYSPENALPYVSKVDAGTVELVRRCGASIVSSAELLLQLSRLTCEQLQSHYAAAALLDSAMIDIWGYISSALEKRELITEWQLQQRLKSLLEQGGAAEYEVLCAFNDHSANPHYCCEEGGAALALGDWVLIDISCRLTGSQAIWADITRVAVADKRPTAKQQQIFSLVNSARHATLELIRTRLEEGKVIRGYEADACCRALIEKAGYGDYFLHRTGHNLGRQLHGNGTHLDDLESHDTRPLLPASCFTIEPGIYLPGEWGVRLEWSVVITREADLLVTDAGQEEIIALIPLE